MGRFFALCLFLLGLSSTSALAESQSLTSLFARRPLPPAVAAAARGAARVAAVAVDRTAISKLRADGGGRLALPLPDGTNLDLTLTKFDLFTDDATITSTGLFGPRRIPMDLTLFKGTVDGDSKALVVLSMSSDQVLGTVELERGRFAITPGTDLGADHLVAEEGALVHRPFDCGADQLPELGLDLENQRGGKPSTALNTPTRLLCNVAVDCDYEFYTRLGSNLVNATNYIATVMATVSVIYERDVNVTLKVPYLNLWTTAADPYSTTTTSARLTEFQTYWNANRTGVSRTLAINISGQGLGGGIAWIDQLCNITYGYAVAQVDESYSYPNNSTTWDINVVAHELGHNFGSYHTHSCQWQAMGYTPAGTLLDSCNAQEGTCYSGPVGIVPANKGTIMSYCHLLGPIASTVRLDFHPACMTLMRIRSEVCLGALGIQPPRALTATTTPSGVSLSWTASPTAGVIRYDIYHSNTQLALNPTLSGSTTGTQFVDASIGGSYFKVRAVRAADQSEFSNEAKVATPACAPSSPAFTFLGDQAVDVAQGDFNEDGITDLAVVLQGAEGFAIMMGQGAGGIGNGTFAPAVTYSIPTGSSPSAIAVGDFNHDGISDLAIAYRLQASIHIWNGLGADGVGDGEFAHAAAYATAPGPNDVLVGDFNEDGIADLAAACEVNTVSVLRGGGSGGVGDGTFGAPTDLNVNSPAHALASGDFNHDGILDLAAAVNSGVAVLLGSGAGGLGDGTFTPAVVIPAGSLVSGVATGDFNEDGITDLATANAGSNTVSVILGQGAGGIGNGTFAAPVQLPSGTVYTASGPIAVAVCDWDRNGIADLVACNNTQGSISIFPGKGTGSVGNGQFDVAQVFNSGPMSRFALLGDFNSNGVADLVTANYDLPGRVSILSPTCAPTIDTSINVVTPNGGEVWNDSTNHAITWTRGPGVISVDLDLSRDGGLHWEPIASGLTGTSFDWTVTEPLTQNVRVRVRDSSVPMHFDQSNADFTLYNPTLVGVEVGPGVSLALKGVSPNPARSELRIDFTLASAGSARIDLVDLAGRRVRTMEVGSSGPGPHSVTLASGASLHPGVYFVRLTQGGASVATKAVFMK